MPEQKYLKGDRVRVLVGNRVWCPLSYKRHFPLANVIMENDKWAVIDIMPHYTEDIGTIEYTYGQMSEIDNKYSKGEDGYKKYSIKFDKYGSVSWFDERDIVSITEPQ